MTGDLRCEAVRDPPLVVLRVVGELDLSSSARLLAAMLKCLADQSAAVLVDAAALTVSDDVHLTVFAAVARHAAAWPSIPVLVCAPPPITASLRRLGIDRRVTLCRSVAEGRVRAAGRPLPATIRDRFPPTVNTAKAARHWIDQACRNWGLPDLAPTAGLIVTELVTNAVRHARTPAEVVVTRTRQHVHIAVRDYVPEPARLVGPPAETEPGGRGLLIVEAFSTCWGCTPTRDGKVTWATLSTRRTGTTRTRGG
jgi:anti-anti-sigma regulatory factor/anti-sigma regulatory factor (Ser/Thr protein kinase)